MSEWTNYGDMNPLEHGGIFVKEDGIGYFDVVRITNMDIACGEDGYLIDAACIDISDDWISWDKVYSFQGADGNECEDFKACMAFEYYGALEFGGTQAEYGTKEEVIEELERWEIKI